MRVVMSTHKANAATASLLALEQFHAQSATLPAGEFPFLQVYLAHLSEWDAKRSEALVLQEKQDPLLEVRALLFRGQFEEAELLLKTELKNEYGPREKSEFFVEQIRGASLNGEWSLVLDLVAEAGTLELTPLSKTQRISNPGHILF